MKFDITAVNAIQQVVTLELEASDEVAARALARQRGYAVLATRAQRRFGFGSEPRIARFPTTLFTIELHSLLEAGLNVVEALRTLDEKEPKGAHREVLGSLLGSLNRGEPLSQAVAGLPHCFSALCVATIKSSERTGDLKEALARYIAYQEQLDRVRKKVLAALLYPAILLVVGASVLAFLVLYVVPRFARVYEDIAVELPLLSSAVLWTGRWVDHHAALVGISLSAVVGATAYLLSRQSFRASMSDRLFRAPLIGERVRIYQLGRFYRTVGMLLRAGIPAPRALEMVSGLLAPNLRKALSEALVAVNDGGAMSVSLTAAGLATPVATRMMMVGERSGQMGELMDRAARFYDDETARFVELFTRILEPALMTALGLAVGLIVVLMYLPIFELAGAVQ